MQLESVKLEDIKGSSSGIDGWASYWDNPNKVTKIVGKETGKATTAGEKGKKGPAKSSTIGREGGGKGTSQVIKPKAVDENDEKELEKTCKASTNFLTKMPLDMEELGIQLGDDDYFTMKKKG